MSFKRNKCSCPKLPCVCSWKIRQQLSSDYLTYEDMQKYLSYLADVYKNYVSLHTIGMSWNNLPIKALVIDWCNEDNLLDKKHKKKLCSQESPISHLPRQHRNRNVVLIEAGTHGCEWLSISTALCCMQQLIEKNNRERKILRILRFVIVPLTNPDGYLRSQTKRTWRQNFNGTDCNRNYDINWEDGCNCHTRNTYKGDHAFSEPETRAMRNLLQILGRQLLMVISLHSHAQSIMYPWGYKHELPKGWEHLRAVANIGRKVIRDYSGRYYRVGSIMRTMRRQISGSFVDYAYEVIKVPFAFCIELPGRNLGFQPPKKYVHDLAMESFFGIRAMCITALNLMPTLATERLLRSYQAPKFINVLNELIKTDLQKICQLMEENLKKDEMIESLTTEKERELNSTER